MGFVMHLHVCGLWTSIIQSISLIFPASPLVEVKFWEFELWTSYIPGRTRWTDRHPHFNLAPLTVPGQSWKFTDHLERDHKRLTNNQLSEIFTGKTIRLSCLTNILSYGLSLAVFPTVLVVPGIILMMYFDVTSTEKPASSLLWKFRNAMEGETQNCL